MALVILITLISATAAGFACAFEHGYAERHAWQPVERYTAGAFTWLIAFAAPLTGAVLVSLVPIDVAVLLYFGAWVQIGGMAIGTAFCYQRPIALPDEDALEAKINEALRK